MSFPLTPPNNVPMLDKRGLVTPPWGEFFTRLALKLNSPELNFAWEQPDLLWRDPAGNPHVIASE